MKPYLVDTNILSELRRPRPEPRVMVFIAAQRPDDLFVSVVSFAELRFGIERLPVSQHRLDLQEWLDRTMRPAFAGRTVGLSEEVILRWRVMIEQGRKTGRTPSQPDLMIAATAIEHDLTIVTRNTKDFQGLGITLLNPWLD